MSILTREIPVSVSIEMEMHCRAKDIPQIDPLRAPRSCQVAEGQAYGDHNSVHDVAGQNLSDRPLVQ